MKKWENTKGEPTIMYSKVMIDKYFKEKEPR